MKWFIFGAMTAILFSCFITFKEQKEKEVLVAPANEISRRLAAREKQIEAIRRAINEGQPVQSLLAIVENVDYFYEAVSKEEARNE